MENKSRFIVTEDRDGIEWDIDRNLPVYTRDLVELARGWTPDGERTLGEIIEKFADQCGKPGG